MKLKHLEDWGREDAQALVGCRGSPALWMVEGGGSMGQPQQQQQQNEDKNQHKPTYATTTIKKQGNLVFYAHSTSTGDKQTKHRQKPA